MPPLRVLLADDHDLFREDLAGLINAEPDLDVVGQAADGLEALEMALRLRPDILVMDFNMPLCDGSQATRLMPARAKRVGGELLVESSPGGGARVVAWLPVED